jgi:hypothetical protein
MTGITLVPEEGDVSPWNHIRAQPDPCRDQSMLAPILTTLGVPTWPDVCCRSPFHSTSPRAWSLAPQPPSVIWKETPGSHRGCALPSSSNLHSLTGSGSRDPLPNGAWWSVSRWGLQNVVGKSLAQREQDSNPGRWRKGRLMLVGQHLDISKMAPALSSG